MVITYSSSKEAALRGNTCINNIFILEHMRVLPTAQLRVYLFALMQYQNPFFANEDMSLALDMTPEEIAGAFDALQTNGYLRIVSDSPMHIEFLDYFSSVGRAGTIAAGEHSELMSAIREVSKSRIYTATDIRRIYDWSEVFGLSDEVIVMLVTYCLETKGLRVSVRYMDEVAKNWADIGIANASEASELIHNQSEDISAIREIKKRWRVARNATADEIALYKKWTDEWHIPQSIIMQACSEAVNATNPSFGYLDAIMNSYMENGVIDIDSYDKYKKKQIQNEEFARQLFNAMGAIKKPSRVQVETIARWISDWNIPKDALLLLAEHIMSSGRVQQFSYMSKTVAEWNAEDIRNVEAARAYIKKKEIGGSSASRAVKKPAAAKYSQRTYSRDDLVRLGMSFGEDEDDNDTNS